MEGEGGAATPTPTPTPTSTPSAGTTAAATGAPTAAEIEAQLRELEARFQEVESRAKEHESKGRSARRRMASLIAETGSAELEAAELEKQGWETERAAQLREIARQRREASAIRASRLTLEERQVERLLELRAVAEEEDSREKARVERFEKILLRMDPSSSKEVARVAAAEEAAGTSLAPANLLVRELAAQRWEKGEKEFREKLKLRMKINAERMKLTEELDNLLRRRRLEAEAGGGKHHRSSHQSSSENLPPHQMLLQIGGIGEMEAQVEKVAGTIRAEMDSLKEEQAWVATIGEGESEVRLRCAAEEEQDSSLLHDHLASLQSEAMELQRRSQKLRALKEKEMLTSHHAFGISTALFEEAVDEIARDTCHTISAVADAVWGHVSSAIIDATAASALSIKLANEKHGKTGDDEQDSLRKITHTHRELLVGTMTGLRSTRSVWDAKLGSADHRIREDLKYALPPVDTGTLSCADADSWPIPAWCSGSDSATSSPPFKVVEEIFFSRLSPPTAVSVHLSKNRGSASAVDCAMVGDASALLAVGTSRGQLVMWQLTCSTYPASSPPVVGRSRPLPSDVAVPITSLTLSIDDHSIAITLDAKGVVKVWLLNTASDGTARKFRFPGQASSNITIMPIIAVRGADLEQPALAESVVKWVGEKWESSRHNTAPSAVAIYPPDSKHRRAAEKSQTSFMVGTAGGSLFRCDASPGQATDAATSTPSSPTGSSDVWQLESVGRSKYQLYSGHRCKVTHVEFVGQGSESILSIDESGHLVLWSNTQRTSAAWNHPLKDLLLDIVEHTYVEASRGVPASKRVLFSSDAASAMEFRDESALSDYMQSEGFSLKRCQALDDGGELEVFVNRLRPASKEESPSLSMVHLTWKLEAGGLGRRLLSAIEHPTTLHYTRKGRLLQASRSAGGKELALLVAHEGPRKCEDPQGKSLPCADVLSLYLIDVPTLMGHDEACCLSSALFAHELPSETSISALRATPSFALSPLLHKLHSDYCYLIVAGTVHTYSLATAREVKFSDSGARLVHRPSPTRSERFVGVAATGDGRVVFVAGRSLHAILSPLGSCEANPEETGDWRTCRSMRDTNMLLRF